MSTQPKPTGAWTEESVRVLFEINAYTREQGWQAVADAHNAEQQPLVEALIKIANDPDCDRCQVAVNALAKVNRK